MNGPQAVVNPFDIITRGELTARVRIGTHAQMREDGRRSLAASTIQQRWKQLQPCRKLRPHSTCRTVTPSRTSPLTAGACMRSGRGRSGNITGKALAYPTTPCAIVEQPVSWEHAIGATAGVDEGATTGLDEGVEAEVWVEQEDIHEGSEVGAGGPQ